MYIYIYFFTNRIYIYIIYICENCRLFSLHTCKRLALTFPKSEPLSGATLAQRDQAPPGRKVLRHYEESLRPGTGCRRKRRQKCVRWMIMGMIGVIMGMKAVMKRMIINTIVVMTMIMLFLIRMTPFMFELHRITV